MGRLRGDSEARRVSQAFAPGAITNFFQIHYGPSGKPDGATGGGYILSRGTRSVASFAPSNAQSISTTVNGDPNYNARTTRRALELLTSRYARVGKLAMSQFVQTPIGSGFGASGASAVSAVFAASAAMEIHRPKRDLAIHAHEAEIRERTGLGTVSVVYDATGAGAIVSAGEPGVARFKTVRVPRDLRIVTAYLAPYHKKEALSSPSISSRINKLGADALAAFLRDPTLETLAEEGERFSARLGLESPEVKKLLAAARSSGATYASQNMIGYSTHALTHTESCRRVMTALKRLYGEARVEVFEVGRRRAGLLNHR